MSLAPHLISVIIPCYNCERFLQETLESVFQQTFTNYEIILVDDGSTDKTADIIKSYDSKVRAEFTPNRGASAARNLGTSLATGEFIQYLDADDLLLPDALEKRITSLKVSGADVVYSDWQKLVETEAEKFELGEITSRKIEDINPDPQIAIFTDFWCPPAALLYRHSTVSKIGSWNESLPIIQDARFLLDAALIGSKFVYVPEVEAYYRVHKDVSLSRRSKIKFTEDCFENACQVEAFWQDNGGMTMERKNALIKVYGQVARFFFECDRTKFSEVLAKIHNIKPNYVPYAPKILRLLSFWFGYENSELVALTYRKIKRILPI
ncbi:MAG: glycosyltransferase [Dolichospermum sp.]|jgi:glycosyltransferase involved in cell wall biosynthesis